MKKKSTLRGQFVTRIFIVMLSVAVITGGVQMWLMYKNIGDDINNQGLMISESIQQGIKETDLASTAIEHQIDLKLESYSKRIADKLRGKKIDQISNEELVRIRDEIGVAGITLFIRTEDDLVGAKATDPKEIGFQIKKVYPYGFQILDDFMHGKPLSESDQKQISYYNKNMDILFITQSTSNTSEPQFFKYGYYREDGLDYMINPYIEADDVDKFTRKVGPDAWIEQVLQHNNYAEEIAVLDPRVFADPALAKQTYPPLKQVVHGKYKLADQRDTAILTNMIKNPKNSSYLQSYNGKKIYKIFLPFREDRILYIGLNYDKMAWPYYRHTVVVVISGFIALVAVFMLTTRFFSRIYRNIQQIIKQIQLLEAGDFTAKSKVQDKGELGSLSDSTNRMVDTLHHVLKDTHDKATKAQRLSVLLEAEANQSVEKAYTMSMETTSNSRESVEEVIYFLDQVKEQLEPQRDEPKAKEILDKIDEISRLVNDQTNNATEITITLSDLFKSLHGQSSELSDISKSLFNKLAKFKL